MIGNTYCRYQTVRRYNSYNSCVGFVRNQTAPLQFGGNTGVAAGHSKKYSLYGNISQNIGAAISAGRRKCLAARNKIMCRQVAQALFNTFSSRPV